MHSTDVKNIFIEDTLVPWEDVDPGVKRKIMAYDDNLMVVKVQFEKGGIGSVHQHSHSQISHIESGQFEIEINGYKKCSRQEMHFMYLPTYCMVLFA